MHGMDKGRAAGAAVALLTAACAVLATYYAVTYGTSVGAVSGELHSTFMVRAAVWAGIAASFAAGAVLIGRAAAKGDRA